MLYAHIAMRNTLGVPSVPEAPVVPGTVHRHDGLAETAALGRPGSGPGANFYAAVYQGACSWGIGPGQNGP